MGVLTEIASADDLSYNNGYIENFFLLPAPVMQKVGMKSPNGQYDLVGTPTLAMLNDSGHDFNYIADVIEAHAEEL